VGTYDGASFTVVQVDRPPPAPRPSHREQFEAELRPRWGGRLCVTRQQRSHRGLQRIQRELQGPAGAELGLHVLTTGIDDHANAVTVTVVVLEERARRALEARHGAGAVLVDARLTPVG